MKSYGLEQLEQAAAASANRRSKINAKGYGRNAPEETTSWRDQNPLLNVTGGFSQNTSQTQNKKNIMTPKQLMDIS